MPLGCAAIAPSSTAIPASTAKTVMEQIIQNGSVQRGWIGVGTGFAAGDGVLATRLQARFTRIDARALPHAADVARLGALMFARGEAIAPERIEPAYLRNNVALTIAEQQALRASR